jgi:ankyrin repeat protein
MINAFVEASTSGIFTFTLVVRRRMPFNSRNILYEASYGTVETVAHFLRHEKGCVHDVYAFDGRSVLGLALTSSKPGRIEIVRLLLQNGANPDVEDDFGLSFRAWVSQRIVLRTLAPDYIQALEGLLSISCIEALDLSYIHKIVLGILPINLSQALQKPIGHLLNAKSLTGCTPLIYAAWNGNVAAVRALIDAGADVNEVDLRGVNALHYAAISKAEGGPLCVDALLQAGSDYNASTWYGYSPLHTVTENDHVGNGRRLIDAGADIEAKTGTGSTPMTRAVVENAVGMIRCLYDAGASLESTNSDRDTALFVAIESHMKEAAVLLLSLGANAAHVNRKGRTLLHYAAVFLRFETMRTFTEVNVRGQDATARDQDGLTAPQLLEKRQPDAETRTAFAHLVQAWCRPKEADDGASDEEDRFHDAVEFVDGALTS